MTLSRHQVRAARALLGLSGAEFAAAAKVGVATLRRFERGADISELHVEAIKGALEKAGLILIEPGATLDGRRIGEGVAFRIRRVRTK